MSNIIIDRELAREVIVYEARQSVGEPPSQRSNRELSVPCSQVSLCATFDTTKGTTLPLATSHELEGSGRDFLASSGDTNDGRYSPSCIVRRPSAPDSVQDLGLRYSQRSPLWQASRA